jgi:hypothetical protein
VPLEAKPSIPPTHDHHIPAPPLAGRGGAPSLLRTSH